MPRDLYSRIFDVVQTLDRLASTNGTGQVVGLAALAALGCASSPALIGRVMASYGHIVRDDLRLRADVTYDTATRTFSLAPPLHAQRAALA